MKKYISLGIGIALFISPVFASAQTTQTNTSIGTSLIAVLTQLVQTLEQELQQLLALHNSPASTVQQTQIQTTNTPAVQQATNVSPQTTPAQNTAAAITINQNSLQAQQYSSFTITGTAPPGNTISWNILGPNYVGPAVRPDPNAGLVEPVAADGTWSIYDPNTDRPAGTYTIFIWEGGLTNQPAIGTLQISNPTSASATVTSVSPLSCSQKDEQGITDIFLTPSATPTISGSASGVNIIELQLAVPAYGSSTVMYDNSQIQVNNGQWSVAVSQALEANGYVYTLKDADPGKSSAPLSVGSLDVQFPQADCNN